jgi:hypothetical protein
MARIIRIGKGLDISNLSAIGHIKILFVVRGNLKLKVIWIPMRIILFKFQALLLGIIGIRWIRL